MIGRDFYGAALARRVYLAGRTFYRIYILSENSTLRGVVLGTQGRACS